MSDPDTVTTPEVPDAAVAATDGPPPAGWQERSLCRQTDPDMFFFDHGREAANAKRICASCPVQAECLQDAVARNEEWGIWGGMTGPERRKIAKQIRTNLRPAS